MTTAQKAESKEVLNYLIRAYATLGLSNRAIRTHLGVTDNYIYKILKPSKIKRVDYRDALNPVGKMVVQKLDRLAERKLVEHLERYLLK
jgi:transposase